MPPKHFSFIARADKRMRVLLTSVRISPAFDPITTASHPQMEEFGAIWDTGATGTVVTQRVIDKCALKPTGMTNVHTANGPTTSPTYLVNVGLPNRVMMGDIKVTRGVIHGDVDVLIGMDIISQGDLAVTNYMGKTAFTFRIPSLECIDFVKSSPSGKESLLAPPQAGRNDPCPCGSGKKFKRCCGRNPQ